MTVNQILELTDDDTLIIVDGYDEPVDKSILCNCRVADIPKEDPLTKMHVVRIATYCDRLLLLVQEEEAET